MRSTNDAATRGPYFLRSLASYMTTGTGEPYPKAAVRRAMAHEATRPP